MSKLITDHGEISISNSVVTTITGAAATSCFGVKGMCVRGVSDGIVHLLQPQSMAKGVKVTDNDDGSVSIELHIMVENGVNITTVCKAIISEVKFKVTRDSGIQVRRVDVYVDSISMA